MQKFLFDHSRVFYLVYLGLCGSMMMSCATSDTSQVEVSEKQRVLRTQEWEELRAKTEPSLKFVKDSQAIREVQIYMREVGLTLVAVDSELADLPLGVILIEPRLKQQDLIAIPGNRIYLTTRLLKKLIAESELAALLGYSLGLIQNWDPKCSKERSALAVKFAVKSLYEVGYDVRALSRLNQEGLLPCGPDEEDLTHEIKNFTPLRNPILNTERFSNAKKKVK